MEKTLYAQLREILEALPEGVDEVAVLKPVLENERKKNVLLDRIIRQETLCAKEIEGLVRWTHSLQWNIRAEAYPLDENLKSLVDTGAWFFVPRVSSYEVRAENTYKPSSMVRGLFVATGLTLLLLPLGILFGAIFSGLFQKFFPLFVWPFGWKITLFAIGLLVVGGGFLMKRSMSRDWIETRIRLAEDALARAKWLDQKIQLAYAHKGEQS